MKNKIINRVSLILTIVSLVGCNAPDPIDDPIIPPVEQWTHYNKVEATSSSDGNREYWINNEGKYQFTKPSSNNITEATSATRSDFITDDPRYIKYVNEDKVIFYETSSSSYDCTEMPVLTDYSCSCFPNSLGQEMRVEFYKNDSSPMYSALISMVTATINSNSDLAEIQQEIQNNDISSGYFVFTSDLNNPSTCVQNQTNRHPTFSGIIDGRNHTISNPYFEGIHMLGDINGAVIKNLSFTNIRYFSILGWHIKDTILSNLTFELSNSININSGIGLICDAIEGNSQISNCIIDFKDNYVIRKSGDHQTCAIAAYNSTSGNLELFENTTVKCMGSVPLFLYDYSGRGLRPTYSGLTYVSTYKFVDNGILNYSIKYLENNDDILKAATYIQNGIKNITGKTAPMSSFSSKEILYNTEPNIVIGSRMSLSNMFISSPSESGDYFIKTVGKSIFINAHDDYSYQSAAIEFMEKAFGYEHLYRERESWKDVYINDVEDSNNIDTLFLNISNNSPFKYRRIDSGDGYYVNEYDAGFTTRGYSADDVYFDIPGISEDLYMYNQQRFHTTTILLYPGEYLSTHEKWFMTDSNGVHPNPVGSTKKTYIRYQLCFTAHGDTSEYNAMVNETALKIKAGYDSRSTNQKNSRVFCLGIGDNMNTCQCSYCKAATTKYGSISGTLIKFCNDVQNKLNTDYGNIIDIWTLAYDNYQLAPIVNGTPTINSDVTVMVAPIQANYNYSIDNSTYNSESKQMFEQWGKVGKIASWLYETNFRHYLYPYNSFESMCDSIKFMASNNVEMAYIEGQHNIHQYRTGFNQLKTYLKSKFMNQPFTSNYTASTNRFFKYYYGEGGTKMKQFYDEMVSRMSTFETNSTYRNALYTGDLKSITSNIDSAVLWDKTQLESWVSLCENAENITTDKECKKHIKAESIFPRFCLITSFADTYSSSTLSSMRSKFKEIATSLLISRVKESGDDGLMTAYYSQWGLN